jgi:AhpD family alkylhydroperoxidase
MTRVQPAHVGPLFKLLLRLLERRVGKMTGRQPDGMLGPVEAYARIPRLMLSYGMLEGATAGLHRVPERLKLLAELKASTMTSCEYCIDIGSQIARRGGISDEELLAIARYRESELFDELDKLVLDYAVGMSRTPVDVPDELFGRLRRELDDTQLVELTNVIALENMRGRFNLALGFGAAGFSEGLVCAVPDADGHAQVGDRPVADDGGAPGATGSLVGA